MPRPFHRKKKDFSPNATLPKDNSLQLKCYPFNNTLPQFEDPHLYLATICKTSCTPALSRLRLFQLTFFALVSVRGSD